jgi:L-seryl-tRNA(Ser) seleniumtransferase
LDTAAGIMSELRRLPSVDALLRTEQAVELIEQNGRELTVEAIRQVLDDARNRLSKNSQNNQPTSQDLIDQAASLIGLWLAPTLKPVINATGVILHTNLGRAPLSSAALEALLATASGYSALEYDLSSGSRSSRSIHTEELLCRLTGAGAAMVVNNNAAALLLVLTAFARRKGVVLSRTQLVEIGGGFRMPEVMIQSGAKLIEVGATNRVALEDYEAAIEKEPVAIFHAHHSNYKIIGFTSEPPLQELTKLAHAKNLLMIDDQGSGALLDTGLFGLGHEPTVQESLAAGCDLVCFSGDKLLGGPQAGIIVGKAELIAKMEKHPLTRALRADKLCLAALSATLNHYLKGEAESQIPVWQMISSTHQEMTARATAWKEALGQGNVINGESTVGGGSLPEETLPTSLLALEVRNPDGFLATLRRMDPPLIARIENDQVVLDPRTVLSGQEAVLLSHLRQALS